MEFPKEVKIGGVIYTVEEKDTVDSNPMNYGVCVYHDCHIEIKKDLSVERKEQTLIHEILHAIFFEAGLMEHEEDVVNRVGAILYQVLKENNLGLS